MFFQINLLKLLFVSASLPLKLNNDSKVDLMRIIQVFTFFLFHIFISLFISNNLFSIQVHFLKFICFQIILYSKEVVMQRKVPRYLDVPMTYHPPEVSRPCVRGYLGNLGWRWKEGKRFIRNMKK